jgi:Zn finger protein HypA/HybF involved in hydrogenase expression
MHEEALLRDLRRKVDELSVQHGGARIVRARVTLGALSHLDEPRLRELWTRAMHGGAGEAAALEVNLLPGLDDPRSSSVVLESVTFGEPPPSDRPGGATPRPSPSSEAGR